MCTYCPLYNLANVINYSLNGDCGWQSREKKNMAITEKYSRAMPVKPW